MALESILKLPADSPNLMFRFEPFGRSHRDQLVREILGLANAAFEGDRYLVFGVHYDGGERKVVGLTDGDLATLKEDLERARKFVEPGLKISAIKGEVEENQVAAIVLKDCQDPPYIVKENISERLQRGECWVRVAGELRPAQRRDFDRMYGRAPVPSGEPDLSANASPGKSPDPSPDLAAVVVGFNGVVDSNILEVEVPDVSNPPSKQAADKLKQAIEAKKSAENLFGKTDTGIARLVHTRLHGVETPFEAVGVETMIEGFNADEKGREKADRYYFYEEQAIRLNLSALNKGSEVLENAIIELTVPRSADFDLADRVHSPVGKNQSTLESEMIGYPDVERIHDGALVRETIGALHPGEIVDVFKCPLRFAVRRSMRGKKVALRYTISAQNLEQPVKGRLKVVFSR